MYVHHVHTVADHINESHLLLHVQYTVYVNSLRVSAG